MNAGVFLRLGVAVLCAVVSLSAFADIVDIDISQLERLSASGVPVIDVRTEREWKETGVVPGSHALTFFDEGGRSDPDAWLAKARTFAKANAPVVLICRSGNRSRRVAQFLAERAGYSKVYNVTGGMLAWVAGGRPVSRPAIVPGSGR